MSHALASPIALFMMQATAIILLSRVVGVLARRLGQPSVVAEIAAGILLGPSLLGWLAPTAMTTLFPASSMPLLHITSQVGLVLFMFLIGLELDPKLLRGRGHASVVISHTSIIVPFALGAVSAVYLEPILSVAGVPFSSFTLFMGIAMSITAFPVLARILTERRLLRTRVGAMAIACAAVDDVTAWCLLAFVVAIVRASALSAAASTTALAAAYIAGMIYLVRPFLARLAARSRDREGVTQNVVAFAFVLLFLSAWTTEVIGIHALFGAFLLGAIMPREGGFTHLLAEKMEDLVVVLLLPLFFAYSGLRTQIGLLDTAMDWWLCALLIGVACVGKFGGSTLAARFTGMRWREAGALGILMNTRGLMELIVLNIGLDLGVISPRVFTMMVLMALVTTVVTTPVLRWVFPDEEMIKDLVASDEAKELAISNDTARPAHPATGFSILMCVADDRSGPGMLRLATAMVEPGAGQLHALHLLRPPERTSTYLDAGDGQSQPTGGLSLLLRAAESRGVEVRPLSFVSANPASDICNVAEVKQVDLVLLGWHKPLITQARLGGTVVHVMDHANSDVAVCIDRGLRVIERVLVPFSGSEHDRAALALARRLGQHSGARITVLHVVAPDRGQDAPRLGAETATSSVFHELGETVSSGQGSARGFEVELKVVERAQPDQAVLEEAAHGYDLLLIGAGPVWGLEGRHFGLLPETVIRDCPISLLVVSKAMAANAGGQAVPGSAASAEA